MGLRMTDHELYRQHGNRDEFAFFTPMPFTSWKFALNAGAIPAANHAVLMLKAQLTHGSGIQGKELTVARRQS